MTTFLVTWVDGVKVYVDAHDGTEAKATARAQRGVKKSECKIASVAPIAPPAPPAPADKSSVTQ